VTNSLWKELVSDLIASFQLSFALVMMGTLFVLVRGGIPNYSAYLNAIFVLIAFQLAAGLFMGGERFFRYALKLESKSRECWSWKALVFSQNSTRHDRAFVKSCRPIRIYIGSLLSIKNREIPLIFFGQIIATNTINLLLTFH